MSIFDKFRRQKKPAVYNDNNTTFKIINANSTQFYTWNGQLYDQNLIRSAVDARARHISKLKCDIITNKKSPLMTYLRHQPNELQTWSQFLYRVSTILDVFNTCIIVPTLNNKMQITGYYPIIPATVSVVAGPVVYYRNDEWLIDDSGVASWITYRNKNGVTDSIPLSLCSVLTKFQLNSDYFGESNRALNNTMELINLQNQAIQNAVKSSAGYRFMAQVNNFTKSDDLAKERKRFSEDNLSADSSANGLLLFPNTYSNIQQIKDNQFVIPSDAINQAKANVYDYFGVSEDVIQNKVTGDAYNAFYEGAVEPFAIQLAETMSRMLFTDIERSNGNGVFFSSNRLQYLSNSDKMLVSEKMADRGLMSINEIREIWNMPSVPDGDNMIVRGEYKLISDLVNNDRGETDE